MKFGEIKFWAKVDRSNPEACWPFPGAPNPDGYPEHTISLPDEYGHGEDRKRKCFAHQISCRLAHGEPVGDRNVVRHKCTTKNCVNPAHLHWGTHQENRQDTIEADRQAKGEGHGRAKLDEVVVTALIKRVRAGETLRPVITGRALGVDPKAIRQIRDRQTWVYLWERIEALDTAAVA